MAQCPLCVFPQEEHRHDHEHNSHGLMGQCVCPEHCNEEQFTRELLCSIGDSDLFPDPLPEMLETLIFSYAHWHGGRNVKLQSNFTTPFGDWRRFHLLLWRGLAPRTSEGLTLEYPFRGLALYAECGLMTDFVETVLTLRLHEQSDYGFIEQPFEGGFHYVEIETLVRGQFQGLFHYVDEIVDRPLPPPAEWGYHYERSQDAMEEHRPVHLSPEMYAAGTGDDRGAEFTVAGRKIMDSKTWFPARTYNRTAEAYTLGKSSRKDRTAWAQKLVMRTEPVTILNPVLRPTIDRLYGDSLPNVHQIDALWEWCRQLHREGLRSKHSRLLESLPHKSNGHLTRAALKYLETEFVYTRRRGKLFRAEREHVYTSPRVQNWGPSGKPNKHALARLRRKIAKFTPISREGQALTPQDSQ